MMFSEWPQFHLYILQLEQKGKVTRTFRRLDPQRQQAVILAILGEAAESGPTDLNIKRVARRAGVAVGSLYQYFGDRSQMLDFAVELCVRYVTESFEQYGPMLAEMPLREALQAYLLGGIEWSQAQTGFLQLFARAAYQGDAALAERLVIPIAQVLRQMMSAIITQAVARGEVRPDVDVEAASRLANALMIAVGDSQLLPYLDNYFQLNDPSLPPERTLNALLDLVLKGIGAEPV
ncbi:MAG: TetR/AcrR family transcriptional regulator [Chloroflexota bacterium]